MNLPALAAVLLLYFAGADAKGDAVKKDLDQLQGVWIVESMELNGKPLSEERRKKIKLTIRGEGKFTFETGKDSHDGIYRVDPTKNPKELDIEVTRGTEKGKIYLVIYKFEDGKMIQCMRQDNKGRASEFTGKAGSGCDYEVWQREKPSN